MLNYQLPNPWIFHKIKYQYQFAPACMFQMFGAGNVATKRKGVLNDAINGRDEHLIEIYEQFNLLKQFFVFSQNSFA